MPPPQVERRAVMRALGERSGGRNLQELHLAEARLVPHRTDPTAWERRSKGQSTGLRGGGARPAGKASGQGQVPGARQGHGEAPEWARSVQGAHTDHPAGAIQAKRQAARPGRSTQHALPRINVLRPDFFRGLQGALNSNTTDKVPLQPPSRLQLGGARLPLS